MTHCCLFCFLVGNITSSIKAFHSDFVSFCIPLFCVYFKNKKLAIIRQKSPKHYKKRLVLLFHQQLTCNCVMKVWICFQTWLPPGERDRPVPAPVSGLAGDSSTHLAAKPRVVLSNTRYTSPQLHLCRDACPATSACSAWDAVAAHVLLGSFICLISAEPYVLSHLHSNLNNYN